MTENLDLIGSVEAAAICGVHLATFLRWRAAGRITAAVTLPGGQGGAYLYHRADVEHLAATTSRYQRLSRPA